MRPTFRCVVSSPYLIELASTDSAGGGLGHGRAVSWRSVLFSIFSENLLCLCEWSKLQDVSLHIFAADYREYVPSRCAVSSSCLIVLASPGSDGGGLGRDGAVSWRSVLYCWGLGCDSESAYHVYEIATLSFALMHSSALPTIG